MTLKKNAKKAMTSSGIYADLYPLREFKNLHEGDRLKEDWQVNKKGAHYRIVEVVKSGIVVDYYQGNSCLGHRCLIEWAQYVKAL